MFPFQPEAFKAWGMMTLFSPASSPIPGSCINGTMSQDWGHLDYHEASEWRVVAMGIYLTLSRFK